MIDDFKGKEQVRLLDELIAKKIEFRGHVFY